MRSIGPIARAKLQYWQWLRVTDLETLNAIGENLKGHDKKKDSPRICPVCRLLKYGKWGGGWELHRDGKFYTYEENPPLTDEEREEVFAGRGPVEWGKF